MEYKAPAKINLFLNVGKKREDSFHQIISIMIKISLFDILKITKEKTFKVDAPAWIPQKENLVYRAGRLFFRESGIKQRCHISLEKNIPAGSGLGGGSSDAAATLEALNKIFKVNFPLNRLEEMGAKLGSDVNFFLNNFGCLVEGRGEKIIPLKQVKQNQHHILLIDPEIKISTEKIYKKYRGGRLTHGKELNNIINKFKKVQWPSILQNDLEDTVFKLYPVLKELKIRLENWGLFPQISGSGSFMFALSNDRKILESVADLIQQNFKFKTYIVKPLTGV